jgi:hypothetical protein
MERDDSNYELNHWIGNNVKAFETYINQEYYYE